MNRIPRVNQDIDVLFYGSETVERIKILNECLDLGLNVHYLFGVYGKERDEYIARSKIVLNLHSSDAKIFEIVRVHYLLNNSKVVVAQFDETTKVESPVINGVVLCPKEKIAEKCFELIHNPHLLDIYTNRGRESLKVINMKQAIEQLIAYT